MKLSAGYFLGNFTSTLLLCYTTTGEQSYSWSGQTLSNCLNTESASLTTSYRTTVDLPVPDLPSTPPVLDYIAVSVEKEDFFEKHSSDKVIKMDQDKAETDFTPNDLMAFLQKMSTKMDDNKTTLEDKIDISNKKMNMRLESIDEEIKDMKDKMIGSDQANRRMELRLQVLEIEMTKSASISKRSNKLKNTLNDQLGGRKKCE